MRLGTMPKASIEGSGNATRVKPCLQACVEVQITDQYTALIKYSANTHAGLLRHLSPPHLTLILLYLPPLTLIESPPPPPPPSNPPTLNPCCSPPPLPHQLSDLRARVSLSQLEECNCMALPWKLQSLMQQS